jgi:hypothetical protein
MIGLEAIKSPLFYQSYHDLQFLRLAIKNNPGLWLFRGKVEEEKGSGTRHEWRIPL